MSVSRGCEVIEIAPETWFCIIAHYEHDHAFERGHNVYGPATSADSVLDETNKREANPGSVTFVSFAEVTERERQLIDSGHHVAPHWWQNGNMQ